MGWGEGGDKGGKDGVVVYGEEGRDKYFIT